MPGDAKLDRFWLPAQLRLDEAVGGKVRSLAAQQHRTVQQQLRYLIELGLSQTGAEPATAEAAPERHEPSQLAFPVPVPVQPRPAQRVTAAPMRVKAGR